MIDSNDQQHLTDPRPDAVETLAIDLSAEDEAVQYALTEVQRRLDAWLEVNESALATQTRADEHQERLDRLDEELGERRRQLEADAQEAARQAGQQQRELDERRSELDRRQTAFDDQQAQLERGSADLDQRQPALDQLEAELQDRWQELQTAQAELEQQRQAIRERQEQSDTCAQAVPTEPGEVQEPGSEAPAGTTVDPGAAAACDEPGAIQGTGERPVGASAAEEAEEQRSNSESEDAGKQRLLRRCGHRETQGPDGGQEPAENVSAGAEPPRAAPGSDNRTALDDGRPDAPDSASAHALGEAREDGTPEASEAASVDLDPETARRLRVLRRLGGADRSDAELLEMIEARGPDQHSGQKARKRWWKRSS